MRNFTTKKKNADYWIEYFPFEKFFPTENNKVQKNKKKFVGTTSDEIHTKGFSLFNFFFFGLSRPGSKFLHSQGQQRAGAKLAPK